MSQRLIDTFFSCVFFAFVNTAGVYLVVADDVFADIKYPAVTIICYIFLYLVSAVAFFGYRVRKVDSLVTLSTLFGKEVVLSANKIVSIQSILSFMYILKSVDRYYLIWNHLSGADKLK